MPDPHLLYVVSAVVVLALVAWVIVVLARAPVLPKTAAKPKPSLDAHLEIQDEKSESDKPGHG